MGIVFLFLLVGLSHRSGDICLKYGPVDRYSFLILANIRPRLLLYPYKLWMAIGHILGWVNSRLILGLVFILVLQPIAIVMKLFGYDPLKIRKEIHQTSYREDRNKSK